MFFAVCPAPRRGSGPPYLRAVFRYLLPACAALFLAVAMLHSAAADGRAASIVSEAPSAPVEDDLYFFGPTLEIGHPVRGDVLALAQRVYINAPVTGTVMAVAQEVIVGPNGVVYGTVRAVGQSVRVNGRVTGDILAAGNDLWISKEGTVERDALVAGGDLEIGGTVGRRLEAAGSSVTISGRIGGPARVDASQLEIEATARLDRGLTYSSENEPSIAPGAQISGAVERVARPNGRTVERSVGSVVVDRLKSMVAPLLLGFLLIVLFPAAAAAVADVALRRLLPSFGLGILALIVIPLLLLVLLLMTIVIGGVMATAVLAAAFAFVLSLGNVVVGMAVGGGILKLLKVEGPSRPRLRMVLELILGVVILTALSVVPVVNVAVSVVTLALTLGAVILAYVERRSLLQWGPRAPAEEAAI